MLNHQQNNWESFFSMSQKDKNRPFHREKQGFCIVKTSRFLLTKPKNNA